jgi:hypothetical protein
VQIRAADAAAAHAHQHLVGAHRRAFLRFDAKVVRGVDDQSFHESLNVKNER